MYKKGDLVRLTNAAKENDCYSWFRDKTLRVTHRATAYMPAEEFFSCGKPNGYHPGYDKSTNSPLYDLETLEGDQIPCSLYSWELISRSPWR